MILFVKFFSEVHKISPRCDRTLPLSLFLIDAKHTGGKRKRFAHMRHLLPGCKLANPSQTYSGLLQIWKSRATNKCR